MERYSDEIGKMLLATATQLKLADLVDDKTVVRSSARGVGSGLLNTRWELFRAGPCLRPLIRIEVVRLPEETPSGKLQVRVTYDNCMNQQMWRVHAATLIHADIYDGHGQHTWSNWQYIQFMLYAASRAAFRMALSRAFPHDVPKIEIVEERKLPD